MRSSVHSVTKNRVCNPERRSYSCELAAVDESVGSTHGREIQRARDNQGKNGRRNGESSTGMAHSVGAAHDRPPLWRSMSRLHHPSMGTRMITAVSRSQHGFVQHAKATLGIQ